MCDVTHMGIPCLTIAQVAHGKLHKLCMFHAMRNCGSQKHVTGIITDFSWYHAWTRGTMKL